MAADTSTITKVNVVPAIIVGGGRVGKALQDMGNGDDLLIKRGETIPVDFAGPILVCTRNDDLEAVLQATPQSRWSGETYSLPIVLSSLFMSLYDELYDALMDDGHCNCLVHLV